MGMFDEVRCKYPLPNPAHNALLFQSKSLGAECDTYEITEDGRLLRTAEMFAVLGTPVEVLDVHQDVYIYETVLQEPVPPGCGMVYAKEGGVFYENFTTKERRPAPKPEWVEYRVRFTEGRVSSVALETEAW